MLLRKPNWIAVALLAFVIFVLIVAAKFSWYALHMPWDGIFH